MAITDLQTLTFNPSSKGWPSFYTFYPEWMIGMNSHLYSFNKGNLYRHNSTTVPRNNYYGIQSFSTITGVLNDKPTEIKLFKTLSYESNTDIGLYSSETARWSVERLETDLVRPTASVDPVIAANDFVEKEGEWFSFIRAQEDAYNWRLRSTHGITNNVTVTGSGTANCLITFATPPGFIISIGDEAYQTTVSIPPATSPTPDSIGPITAISNVVGAYSITIDNSALTSTAALAVRFVLFLKDPIAESQGARGYFLQFTLKNISTTQVELFSVSGSVMKSFP
tara:strand:+ start:12322 stop:13167 length:846 start_codon:yes stop_codon:yes gene_type:complete